MKKTYIAPNVYVKTVRITHIIAISFPQTSEKNANEGDEGLVKYNEYGVQSMW